MKISFVPSDDTRIVIHALLDVFERRGASSTRAIKVKLREMNLPAYFSQQDPEPRMIANRQMQTLANSGMLQLTWVMGEENHLLDSVLLTPQVPPTASHELYELIHRVPVSRQRSQLENLLLADKFRFSADDWRGRAVTRILDKLRAGKSPSPFNLSASDLNSDLLSALSALSTLQAETPYRVFSVRAFNDSKRFEAVKRQLVNLARLGNPEWKRFSAEEVLRELNLVANPTYIHLAGNWQFTVANGEVLSLNGFSPSVGFSAAQIASIQTVAVHADSVLCIENLTSFHQEVDRYTRTQVNNGTSNTKQVDKRTSTHVNNAVLCTHGNPSPSIRRLLRLIPEETKIYLWSDLDYGGFNILSQLRRTVSARIQPYSMDIETLEANSLRAHPLTVADRPNLKRLLRRPELRDVHPVIERLLERGLKLEQEGVQAQ
ncbi:MAG: DUF2399 domain-containing protein [Anaerolineales bacterium]|nr:DUF2399 domain-containing protein [Anaerolineales bacterium]